MRSLLHEGLILKHEKGSNLEKSNIDELRDAIERFYQSEIFTSPISISESRHLLLELEKWIINVEDRLSAMEEFIETQARG